VRSDTPKGKSKGQVKKPPFAETSQLYREAFREQAPCRSVKTKEIKRGRSEENERRLISKIYS